MLYVDPKIDVAFRRLFGRESNKDITISLLNSILGFTGSRAITQINFLSTHLLPDSVELRESIVDVLCEDQNKQKYIVELQVLKPKHFDKRILYYASKAYADQMLKGSKYQDLKKMYFVGILNHEMLSYTQAYKTKHQILDSTSYNHTFKEIEFHILELPKFKKQEDELKTAEDKWLFFLKTAAQSDHIPAKVNEPEIKRAYDEMIEFKWTAEERELYHRSLLAVQDREAITEQAEEDGFERGIQEGIQKGKAEGLAEGEAKGRLEERQAIAKGLHAAKVELATIANSTGLSEEALKELFGEAKE